MKKSKSVNKDVAKKKPVKEEKKEKKFKKNVKTSELKKGMSAEKKLAVTNVFATKKEENIAV